VNAKQRGDADGGSFWELSGWRLFPGHNGTGHTTGVSGEISEEPDAIARKDMRRLRGQKN